MYLSHNTKLIKFCTNATGTASCTLFFIITLGIISFRSVPYNGIQIAEPNTFIIIAEAIIFGIGAALNGIRMIKEL